MADAPLGILLRTLRRLVGPPPAADAGDAPLLERFVAGRDEAAFAELVQRHGPMVLGVCRRVLGHQQDAEDAFQATFLVLARKAGSVRKREALGGWLYEVAYHLALKARADAARRRAHEKQAAVMATTHDSAEEARQALRPVLDEELHRLPGQDRRLLVLCYLQGKTHREAARALGWPPGSVSRRVGHALEMLRARLGRRGVTLAGGVLATALATEARAAVAAALAGPTVRAAVLFASGKAAAGASPAAAALAQGALQAMGMNNLKLGLAAALALAVVVAGAGVVAHQVLAAKPLPTAAEGEPPGPGEPRAAPAPRLDLFGDPLPPGAVARLGTMRLRLGGWGQSLAFSPDGKTLFSAGLGNVPSSWEAATGKEVRQFGEPAAASHSTRIALSPDGTVLAVGTGDGPIVLWDAARGKELRRLTGHPHGVICLAFAPDGKRLVSGGDIDWPPRGQVNPVRVWDVESGTEVVQLLGHTDQVYGVAFSPDGKTIASGASRYDPTLRLWDAATGKELFRAKGHDGELWSVAFSPDGQTLATGSMDKTIRLWDAATGKERTRLTGHRADVFAVAFSPDGKTLASGSADATLRLWDVAAGTELRRFEGGGSGFPSVAFSPDGTTVAAGGLDHALRLWDVASGRKLLPDAGPLGGVAAVAVSPDGRLVASAGGDGAVWLWDAATGKEQRRLDGHEKAVGCVAFSPDGKLLASGSEDKSARVWDTATGQELHRFPATDTVDAVSFSPDGKTLATGHRYHAPDVRLWDVSTGKMVRGLEVTTGDQHGVRGAAFAPDGRLLASASFDGIVALWDPATGKQVGPPMAHDHCARLGFSPDGRTLATGDLDGTLRLWEVATGKERRALKGWPFAFAPDGRTLAAGGAGHAVELVDLAAGTTGPRFAGHRGGLAALAFSPDGTRLVSGSADSTALVWDVSAVARHGPPRADVDLERRWADLADGDAAVAYDAVWALTADPGRSVPYLAERLQPAAAADARRVAVQVADLDSDTFAVREKAGRELEGLGESARVELRKALQGTPTPDVRRRLEQLLARLGGPPTAEALRGMRAVEALERAGTPEARAVLEKLAKGATDARLTQEAKASVERLARRPADVP